jgi:hypothetical protein
MDYGHEQTDKELKKLEKRITEEYEKAYKEVKQKADDYFKQFQKADAEKKKLVDAGLMSGKDYVMWRQSAMLTGKRWDDMADVLAKDMVNADKIAAAVIVFIFLVPYTASLYNGLSRLFEMAFPGFDYAWCVVVMALLTGVISALCVTVYNVVAERTQPDTPVIIMQGWSFLMGGALFSLLFRPWTYHYVPTAAGYFGIAFVVIVGNVMAFTFYIQGVRYIGAEKGILFGFSEPVTAALITFLLLGSKFTVWDFLGFAAIFIMIVLLSHSTAKEKEAEPMNYGGM